MGSKKNLHRVFLLALPRFFFEAIGFEKEDDAEERRRGEEEKRRRREGVGRRGEVIAGRGHNSRPCKSGRQSETGRQSKPGRRRKAARQSKAAEVTT